MDRAYNQAASAAGFVCTGCEDNCCRSLFYHHTYLEYIFLRSGFAELSQARRQEIKERALAYVRSVSATPAGPVGKRMICPLNNEGRCRLYAVRPMICRLHGIPHEFTPPGHSLRLGTGCKAFYDQSGPNENYRLDRTPHYLEMARLEAQFKWQLGLNQKIKLTVAEMLLRQSLGACDGNQPATGAPMADSEDNDETD